MKPNELRIGNYFISKSDEAIYELTYELLAEQFNGKDLGFDDMQPILITEEWLVKFGFVHDNQLDLYSLKGGDFISLCQNITKEYWCDYESYYGLIVELKYVHQLQNLYFALTEKELTIKKKQL